MQIRQNLSILFYLTKRKANQTGLTSIHVLVTIDGLHAAFSLGCKILPSQWNNTYQKWRSNPNAKLINKKIGQTKADIERHFDLTRAQQKIAAPRLVLDSYKSPLRCEKWRQDRIENLTLSDRLDVIIAEYIHYGNRLETLHEIASPSEPVKDRTSCYRENTDLPKNRRVQEGHSENLLR